jgi:hypothetical protein
MPSRSGVGAVQLARRLMDRPHPNPSPEGEGLDSTNVGKILNNFVSRYLSTYNVERLNKENLCAFAQTKNVGFKHHISMTC